MSRPSNLVLIALAALSVGGELRAGGRVLYTNAEILTLDDARPRAAAILVEGDRIAKVYSAAPASRPRGARLVDLDGATVVPGLADAHLHLAGIGREERELNLRGCRSAREAVERARAYAASLPGDDPIVGFGWDQNLWRPRRFPDRALLDQVFGPRVVVLHRIDGHAAWVSSAALELAGINRETRAPAGGRIRRAKGGAPTGLLVDSAIGLVTDLLPAATQTQLEADLEAGARRCAALGLTSVHDMGLTSASLQALRALERRGALPIRVFGYLSAGDPDAVESLPRPPRRSTGLVELRGIKLYADGALGSRGAALKAPYKDDAANGGLLMIEPAALGDQVARIHERGYQVAIHAIGDRGVRVALDSISALGDEAPARRHRIEHAQIVDPADLPAFAAHGVIASMQPTHATSDMGWAEARVGRARLKGAYAWRTLREGGAILAFGSDAPIESAAPLWGLFAAIHRTDHAGAPAGGWRPQERLDAISALEAFTVGPAFAIHREQVLGRLRQGALADFTVLDRDPTAPGADLLATRVLRTVVAGREAFPAPVQ